MPEATRTPDARFSALNGFPFEPNYLSFDDEDFDGLRMHYLDEGAGPPILLLHGEPTWAYLYRKMIGPLSEVGRVVVPDLFGFGRSDKPVDRDWYSYDRHVRSIESLLDRLELDDITLVVQDWGGPIGLRVATEHQERFARLVILNTGVFRPGPGWPTPGFLAWRNFAEANPDLPVGMILQGATATELSPEVIAGYEAPFPDARSKAGAAAFPLLVPMDEGDPGVPEMVATREALKGWDRPTLVAFSDQDPIFPQAAGRRLAERIAGAEFVPIDGASHFLQEDRGETIAATIVDFLARHPLAR
ncbi:MAG TPA: haloalkane dehalogenase [Actinomycetota bacterium]|nr:haloalkane dehalogenase [Actinomycetota bacterium]